MSRFAHELGADPVVLPPLDDSAAEVPDVPDVDVVAPPVVAPLPAVDDPASAPDAVRSGMSVKQPPPTATTATTAAITATRADARLSPITRPIYTRPPRRPSATRKFGVTRGAAPRHPPPSMGPDAPIAALMRTDVITAPPDARLHDVRRLMIEHRIHHVPVVDGDRLLGLLSATDLLEIGGAAGAGDPAEVAAFLDRRHPIAQAMRRDLVTIGPDRSVRHAAALLQGGTFHALPVVDPEGRLLGIVTAGDLLRVLAALPSDPAALLQGA